jgi:uroporphyrinogen decarboxylase
VKPRQRLLAALERRQPDRVPVDIGGSSVSTLIGLAYERLKSALGITAETQYMKRKSRSAILDEAIALRLHADTRPLNPGNPDRWSDVFYPDGSFQDEWGVVWRKPEGGHFNPVGNPLRNAALADLKSYPWPDPLDPGRRRGVGEQAKRLHEGTDYAVVLSLPVGVVHLSQYMRGYENFLMDLILKPEFITALMDRTLDFWCRLADALLDEAGPYVDVVMFGDDVAFDDRPMVDMKRYRSLIKPRHRLMIETLRRKTQAKILYHCCGAVKGLIPEFIDIGVDALNPVQVSSTGMDSAELKALYGKHISFWGGIDTRRVLTFGSPSEVGAEVQRRIADLAPGGGYVLASVHNIQKDVPAENILAMADAAYEYGIY